MKTKSVKVALSHDNKNLSDIDWNSDGVLREVGYKDPNWEYSTDVTITYEVDELTVTITPSQLEEVMRLDGFTQEAIQEVTGRLFKEN